VARQVLEYDARDNLVRSTNYAPDGGLAVSPFGFSGFVTIFDTASNVRLRTIAFDQRRRAVLGDATGIDQRVFQWRLVGSKLVLADASFVPTDQPLSADQERRARAGIAGYEAELLRDSDPALFGGARGILVVDADQGGAGSRAGLGPGDVLVEYAGVKLDRIADLFATAEAHTAPTATIAVVRDGTRVTVDVPSGPLGLFIEAQ
jgi:hypothetical protein